MAHSSQQQFIQICLQRFADHVLNSSCVLEVGSQNINGSIRDYFPGASQKLWIGLDIGNGPGVDFTIPGELIQVSTGWADISFSTECFEHAKQWREIFLNMIRATREDGLIVLTFAGTGRAAHGTIDSDVESSPFTSNYYKNLSLTEFASEFDLNMYFARYAVEVSLDCGDTYFWGIRNANVDRTEWMNCDESLARARGQLDKVIQLNSELKRSNEMLEHEIEDRNKELLVSNKPLLAIYRGLKRAYRAINRL